MARRAPDNRRATPPGSKPGGTLTVSIGIAQFVPARQDSEPEPLVAAAVQALDDAKRR